MVDEPELERQALRVYGRFAVEIVEGYGFCPWAEEAREKGQVRRQVVLGDDPPVDTVIDHVVAMADDASLAIMLLIFPQLPLDRGPFARWAGRVREGYAERVGRGNGVVAMADFHPNASADMGAPERLVPFVRRSPDPTIQVVRMAALEAVRMSDSQGTAFMDPDDIDLAAIAAAQQQPAVAPLHQRVARANLKTVEREGLEAVEARLRDIHDDRRRSYAALGVAPPPWEEGS